jgi:hypothetical protein
LLGQFYFGAPLSQPALHAGVPLGTFWVRRIRPPEPDFHRFGCCYLPKSLLDESEQTNVSVQMQQERT